MLLRLIAIVVISALVVSALPQVGELWAYGVVLVVALLVFGLMPWMERLRLYLNRPSVPSPQASGEKVVSLEEFRKQRAFTQTKPAPARARVFETVFETNFVAEADLVVAFLEQAGLTARVVNRENATILIHPLGEFPVKVVVPAEEQEQALALIRQNSSVVPPANSHEYN